MPHFPFGPLFLALGVLIAGVSVPLYLRRVPPNAWYGVRIPASYRSDRNWYEINRYGAKWMLADAAVTALVGVALSVFPVPPPLVPIFLLAPAVILIPMLVAIFRFGRRLPDA